MKSKLGIASILFLFATLFLKVSGLIRDMVITFYFGDSYLTDAYLAAFIIPNMIILFFTTGMKNAFVPSYIQALENNRGNNHLGQILQGTALISFSLAIIGILGAKYYIPLLYPEFSLEGTEVAIWTAIIFFTAVIFVGINAVLEALLDAENKFSLSAVSQIIVILSSILGAIFFSKQLSIYSLAIGYLVGTVLSLFFKFIIIKPLRRKKQWSMFDWKEIKQFYLIFIPVALTVAIGQINLTVDTIFASYFEGAVTYINIAKNLVHFPQAIFGVVIGTIIFPFLSKAVAKDNRVLFVQGIETGLTTMYVILLPAIGGMMVLMPNIIELIYERGAFSHEATLNTAMVAYLYVGSVLFFSLHNVVTKGYYTLQKGHLILLIGGLSVILNVVLNYLFTQWIGYLGIPLASSLVALLYVSSAFIIFVKLVDGLNVKKVAKEYVKITLATGIMLSVILLIKPLFTDYANILQIIIIVFIGVLTYGLAILICKVESMRYLLQRLPVIGKRFK